MSGPAGGGRIRVRSIPRRQGLALFWLLLLFLPDRSSAELAVGHLVDLTGPTASVGRPYAEGVAAYAEWVNARGGINGKKVELVTVDYGYDLGRAQEGYRRLRDDAGVVAIQGWGTGEAHLLAKQVAEDEIPHFSASSSPELVDPARSPYSFSVVTDYATMLRAGLKYIKDRWKEDRAPKIALMYPDHAYGRVPIPAGRQYAEELGFELVGEEIVGLQVVEVVPQLLNLKTTEPDFAWFGGTVPSCAVALRDARQLGLKTRFLVNIWGNDENLIREAGDATDGVLGLQAASVYGDEVPGMKAILEMTGNEYHMTHFVRGWVSMLVLCEAIRRADEAGSITGRAIKEAAETLVKFETGGLTAPITYTDKDHRPNRSAKIYEYREGRMVWRDTIVMRDRDG